MTPYMGLRGRPLSQLIGVVSGMVFFLYGYDQGNMGGFLTIRSFLEQFKPIDPGADYSAPGTTLLHISQLEGFTVAIWNLGCLVAAVIAIFIGDRLGRKKMIGMGLVLLLVGQILQASSFQWAQFLVGRFVAGLGNGFNCATIPAWQAECTKAHRRGTVLMLTAGCCLAAGLSFAYWMDFAFAWLDPNDAAWRAPIGIQIIAIVAAGGILYFMPESPRWLILKGREHHALEVLAALNDQEPTAQEVRQEFLQIKDAVIEMIKGASKFTNVFKMGDYRDFHRVLLAVGLQFFQQIGGINFMTQYYAQMFNFQYQTVPWVARLLAGCAGTEFFLASFISVWVIDRFCGRRTLLMIGTFGMTISMITLSICLSINTRASLNAGIVFIFVFCTFFAIGWQGMSWLYQVEIVPLRIRGPANAISTSANWLANFIVVMISPPAFVNITWRTYLIFVATNTTILPIIYFFYPDTSNRCLEEVDVIFFAANSSKHPWLDVKQIAANEPLWYSGTDEDARYDYEQTEWHQRHVRFSDEVKDSEGDSTTLRNASDSEGTEKGLNGSDSSEMGLPLPAVVRGRSGSGSGNEARPVVSRGSDTARTREYENRNTRDAVLPHFLR